MTFIGKFCACFLFFFTINVNAQIIGRGNQDGFKEVHSVLSYSCDEVEILVKNNNVDNIFTDELVEYACLCNSPLVSTFLIDKRKLDPHGLIGYYKYSLLMLAVSNDAKAVVEYLITLGVDVNQKNDKGETALLLLSNQESVDPSLMKILLDNGADYVYRNDEIDSPFITFILRKNREIFDLMYNQCIIDSNLILNSWDASFSAALSFDPYIIKKLLPHINTNNQEFGKTFMGDCIWWIYQRCGLEKNYDEIKKEYLEEQFQTLKMIVDYGVNIDNWGKRSYEVKEILESQHFVQHLVTLGWDLNLPDKEGKTVLDYAMYNLLNRKTFGIMGTDVPAEEKELKEIKREVEIINYLLSQGAQLSDTKEEVWKFILSVAQEKDNQILVKYIQKYEQNE